jgi:hypothetical protein
VAAADTDTQLAWEARQRPRAGVAALLAGVLIPGGALWTGTVLADAPLGDFVDSLNQALQSGPVGSEPSVGTDFFQFFSDHTAEIVGSSVVRAIGLLALGWVITFLAVAVRARREDFAKVAVYAGIFGAVLSALSTILGAAGSSLAVQSFLDGPRTVDAASDVASGSLVVTAGLLGLVGQLALASGMVLVCLNAMRVGLIMRFLGILGVIVAALTVLQIGLLGVFVQSVWLFVVGLLLLGRTPGGLPPAWRTGRAEPWPSQRELARARQEPVTAEGPQPTPAPRQANRRRKRKRRN